MDYYPIIGLEVHVELNTKSKMFCSCFNDSNEKHPNVNICPVCTAQPGTLPVINREAIRKVVKTGLALNCQIPEHSKFDRKNYFYPDLPKGYQISQYDMPLCKEGFLDIGGKKNRITRIHLEEDTGRLIHPVRDERAKNKSGKGQIFNGVNEKDYSLVDFNRAGVSLMELVTEPDINSAKEAREFSQELQLILRYLGVSDADMEKGQLRVEVNISLLPQKSEILNPKSKIPNSKLGTKVEIKNLNSFRAVERAIDYEIKRQEKILNSGKKVVQETRGWDDNKGQTLSQREKEEAHDYRYFPEPDLPPLHFTQKDIEEIKAEIPELPQQRRERFKEEYKLDEKSAEFFVQKKDLGEYFEKVVSELEPNLSPEKLSGLIKLATNYLITDLQGLLKGASARPPKFSEKILEGKDFLITPENFAEFITLISEGKISSKIAKMVLEEMFEKGKDPSHIIEERGLVQMTDKTEIEKIVKEVISQNQKAVEDYKLGKSNALEFLVGKAMAQTKGRANPQAVREIFKKIVS